MSTAAARNIRVEKAHARGTVLVKLTILEICLSRIESDFEHTKKERAHLLKVRGWLMRCWEAAGAPPQKKTIDTAGNVVWLPAGKAKPLAAPLQRRIDDEPAAFDRAVKAVVGVGLTLDKWASILVALDALIHDVVCTWEGGKAACWRYFGQTWETMAQTFLAACEDADGAERSGTEIYLKATEVTGWA